MARTFAFGDIHGCYDVFCALLAHIQPSKEDTLIFLGDMIDRGDNSKGVLDRIMALQHECNTLVLMGNHEEMLLNSYFSDKNMHFWLVNGGAETLASFGLPPTLEGLKQIPTKYTDFVKTALPYYETEQFIYCHATPFAHIPMLNQTHEGLRWRKINKVRGNYAHDSGKTIICGHTAQTNGEVYTTKGLICIDTYAYGGCNLTALELKTMTSWQMNAKNKLHKQVVLT